MQLPLVRSCAGVGALVLALSALSPASAQTTSGANVLVSLETNLAGVMAEVIQCERKEGVLSLKVRLRNTGREKVSVHVIEGRNFDDQYVTAAGKKYFVLRDTEKTPLASPADGFGTVGIGLAPGATWVWWAKYPAPPAGISKVTYQMSIGPPLEDVPITDR
jgi:hypothetical protein